MKQSNGIPSESDYDSLLKSDSFHEMERWSNDFLARNGSLLKTYSTRWVEDPLHQWSRQWEYPFVYNVINDYIRMNPREIKILDVGSGATFLPFYIQSASHPIDIVACDIDRSLEKIFYDLNRIEHSHVSFNVADMHSLPYPNSSFDIVYCISVLEHSSEYERAIAEVARVVKKGGIFITTFDVSLDGDVDIPMKCSGDLLTLLRQYFTYDWSPSISELILGHTGADIVTTHSVLYRDMKLLPWRHPYLSYVVRLLRGKMSRHIIPRVTVYCCVGVR